MPVEFDDLLKDVGDFGRYQKLLIGALLLPFSFLLCITVSSVIFQTAVPDYWCHVHGRNSSIPADVWKNLTIPRKADGKFESCSHYKILDSEESFIISNETTTCESGWEFDNSSFHSTVATTLEWYCDKEVYSRHVHSVRYAGNALGTVIFPALADKYTGRRAMMFISMGMFFGFLIPIPWVPWPSLHLILRFLTFLPGSTSYQMCYVIIVELLELKRRSLVSALSFLFWSLGMCFTSILAWLVPDWQILSMISILPVLLVIPFWIYLPESPRWLLSKGRTKECVDVLVKVSNRNRTNIDRQVIEEKIQQLEVLEEKKLPFKSILKHRKICLNFLILVILSMGSSMTYGCVILNINIVPNQYFLNFFILSLVEIPSDITGWLGVQYLGRRVTAILTFFVCALVSFIAVFNMKDTTVLLTLACMIKLLTVQAIYVYYLYIPEILPTPIRSTGMGLAMVAASLSMTISPYIAYVSLGPSFQYWFIAVTMLIGAVCAVFLPETLGLPLPQTFQEAENIGKGRPFFSFINHWNIDQYTAVNTSDKQENEEMKELQE